MYQPEDDLGRQKEAIATLPPPPLPTQKYSLVVADPPWKFHIRESDPTHRNRTPYPNMEDGDIGSLPIGDMADKWCYLLLWTTNAHLPLALTCLERWGFQYKQTYHWIKVPRHSKGQDDDRLMMGTGHWGRLCSESFLVGIKGRPPAFSSLGLNVKNVFYAPRPPEHSRKPEEFWAIANRLKTAYGDWLVSRNLKPEQDEVKAIELFSRRSRPGWDCWGLEAGRFDDE